MGWHTSLGRESRVGGADMVSWGGSNSSERWESVGTVELLYVSTVVDGVRESTGRGQAARIIYWNSKSVSQYGTKDVSIYWDPIGMSNVSWSSRAEVAVGAVGVQLAETSHTVSTTAAGRRSHIEAGDPGSTAHLFGM